MGCVPVPVPVPLPVPDGSIDIQLLRIEWLRVPSLGHGQGHGHGQGQGHPLFAAITTAYILFGVWIEGRDVVGSFGDTCIKYRGRTSMLLPIPKRPSDPR